MELTNLTAFPASLCRTQLFYKDLIMGTAVMKCSFEVLDGEVRPAAEPLAVVDEDQETQLGHLDGDMVPLKEGCDFAVMGYAVAPSSSGAVTNMRMCIRAGELYRTLEVTGDRYWKKSFSGWSPSSPEPFERMLIDYSRAYGGQTPYFDSDSRSEIEITSPLNPMGMGYIEQKRFIDGTRLPNIEESDNLISSWKDRPDPAGISPVPRSLALRGQRGFHVDLETERTTLDPSAFLFCHPKMWLSAYPQGETVEISGMTEASQWRVKLPPLEYSLKLNLGGARYALPMIPDTLVILPEYNRFFVVARRAFVYQIIPERIRTLELVAGYSDSEQELTTISAQRKAGSPQVFIGPENPAGLPFPFDEFISYYPLTPIIENLPLAPSK